MNTLRDPDSGSVEYTTAPADSDRAAEVRAGLVDTLLATRTITSPLVEKAFRTVPRHLFVAEGTPLEVAYNPDDSVAVKRDAHGVIISSTSAPFIQARMIEQAGLGLGMSVVEIGSGGYNAALLAEVVGPSGRVVSVDIDPEVTERAAALLDATGYGGRVMVLRADAENPLPGLDEPVDAVLVTVGAWDLAPSWLAHLSDGGVLVVPLRMNGITRSIGFRREGDHLVSTSAEECVQQQPVQRPVLIQTCRRRHPGLQGGDTGGPASRTRGGRHGRVSALSARRCCPGARHHRSRRSRPPGPPGPHRSGRRRAGGSGVAGEGVGPAGGPRGATPGQPWAGPAA